MSKLNSTFSARNSKEAYDLVLKEKATSQTEALMYLTKTGIIVFLVLLLSAPNFASAQSVPQLAQKALAATVSLEVQDENGDTLGRGSGFFVRPNLIATNFHVIDGAAKGYVRLVNTATSYSIESVTATDKLCDLALLKVTVNGVTPLPIGDSDAVQIGETVYAAGNPQGLEGTFSDGIISGRRDRYTKQERLQMTAPISPGSSGGPVLNRKGEVIGVSTSIYNPLFGQNLNFAVPSKALTTLLLEPESAKPLPLDKQSISAETYRVRAHQSIRLGDYEKAIREFNHAIRLKPNDARSYHERGVAKAKLGKYVDAIADYDKSIRLHTSRHEAYIDRGNAKISLNEFTAALADFNTAIRFSPSSTKAYIGRGDAKYKLERYSEALTDYDIAIRLKPYASAYKGRGNVRQKWKEYTKAIADYDEAIRLDPNDANTYVDRGATKGKLGHWFAAIIDFDEAIRLDPDDANAYVERGYAKSGLELYFDAIIDFVEAIHLDSNDADAYFGRGLMWYAVQDGKMAREDFETALQLAKVADDQGLKADIEKALRQLEE